MGMTEERKQQRAILLGAGTDRQMEDLGRLAQTLGLEVLGTLEQRRRDEVGYLGRGKREELKELVRRLGAGVVVADDELSPSQARVLEEEAEVAVVDRTALITRILEAHARGSRLKKGGPPNVVLVGYTNAGKTTILNALSGENRSSADRLFETLEEAAKDADVIVLCADASSEKLEEEIRTVEEALAETLSGNGVSPKETIFCLNKADLIPEERRRDLAASYPEAVLMSTEQDSGPLLEAVNEALARSRVRLVPMLQRSLSPLQSGEPEQKSPTRSHKRPTLEKTRGLLRLLLALLLTVALLFGVVRPFIVEAFYVPSESMVPTLLVGERLLVNKFIYRFSEPERGDIVVFEAQTADGGEVYLVKRVLGLPGDEIAVRDGVLFLNSVLQRESYLNPDLPDESSFGPVEVPPEHVFVMGDNRANSADSRVFGPVPEKNIVGEAFLRVWPPNRLGLL